MEILKASVVESNEKHFVEIKTDVPIKIPISEDNPNEVKSAFNKLIARLKEGEFKIEMEEVGQDLFSQVASEYITQLNREIQEVRGEMIVYGLAEVDENENEQC
jgi:hypothetical protein